MHRSQIAIVLASFLVIAWIRSRRTRLLLLLPLWWARNPFTGDCVLLDLGSAENPRPGILAGIETAELDVAHFPADEAGRKWRRQVGMVFTFPLQILRLLLE